MREWCVFVSETGIEKEEYSDVPNFNKIKKYDDHILKYDGGTRTTVCIKNIANTINKK